MDAAGLWGAWTAGAIAVPIHEGLRSRQVEHILNDSGASLLVSTRRKLARQGLNKTNDSSLGGRVVTPALCPSECNC